MVPPACWGADEHQEHKELWSRAINTGKSSSCWLRWAWHWQPLKGLHDFLLAADNVVKNKEENGSMGLLCIYCHWIWATTGRSDKFKIIRGTLFDLARWFVETWETYMIAQVSPSSSAVHNWRVAAQSTQTWNVWFSWKYCLSKTRSSMFNTLALDTLDVQRVVIILRSGNCVFGLFVLECVCLSVFEVLLYGHVALPFT
jgi:hypothetical protein